MNCWRVDVGKSYGLAMVENADDGRLTLMCEAFIDNDDEDGFLLDDETWLDRCDGLNCFVVIG